jgi:di/tricarboxylate transporter
MPAWHTRAHAAIPDHQGAVKGFGPPLVPTDLPTAAVAAQGFEKTGLGERVATIFVQLFGKSTLGLAYGLSIAEAFIAPAMPSTTARAGGIFMPIINSLSLADGSKPSAPLPHPPMRPAVQA